MSHERATKRAAAPAVKAAPEAVEPDAPEASEKLTQFDQEGINGRRLGSKDAVRAAQKRADALERSSMPPQRRSTRQGREES